MRRLTATLLLGILACAGAHAQGLLDTCKASSSYDVTLEPGGILFDRAQPAPRRVHMHDGVLRVDGTTLRLGTEGRDRIALFERTARELEPRVKEIADRGVDLAVQAVREEAARATPQLAASGELDAHLKARAADLKARIARSHSSHDWQGAAFQDYVQRSIADIVPLLAADLLQQAMGVAISGDLDAASELRDRAARLPDALEARVRAKLQVLRPEVQALCPSLHQLDRLESGITTPLPAGGHLDLIDIGTSG